MRERTPSAILLLTTWLASTTPAQVPTSPTPAEPTTRLEGIVVDARQRPLPGAAVTVEVDGVVIARTSADGSGEFAVARVPQRLVTVRATTKAPDVGGVWLDLAGLPRHFLRLVAWAARPVSGTVRDERGEPVGGAWVVAAPRDAAEFAFADCSAQADASGHYTLPQVAFGGVRLRAWAPGHDAVETTLDGAAAGTWDAVLGDDSGVRHEFRLADATAEQRAAGVLVVHTFHENVTVPLPPPLRRLRANEEGVWVLEGWPAGDDVYARLEVPGLAIVPTAHVGYAHRGGVHAVFRPADVTTCIRGRLKGLPGPGPRTVWLQPVDPDSAPSLRRTIGRTAADGTFELPSPVDRDEAFALRVLDPELCVLRDPTSSAQNVLSWALAQHGSDVHEITVQPAWSVQLRVVDADGTPVAGAAVGLHTAGMRRRLPGGPELSAGGQALATGTSDRDGRVVIQGLDLPDPAALVCLALAPGGLAEIGLAEALRGAGATPRPGPLDLGDLKLGPGATLLLHAIDNDGHSLPGAHVLSMSHYLIPMAPLHGLADRDGRVTFPWTLPAAQSCWILNGEGPDKVIVAQLGENEWDVH